MKCIVCKVTKARGGGSSGSARRDWVFSSERVAMTRVQLVFKLYDLTKKEFPPGSVCPLCFDLVARLDALEFQTWEITKSLKNRINCCATPEDYVAAHADDPDDEVEEFCIDETEEAMEEVVEEEEEILEDRRRRQQRNRKRGNRPMSTSLTRVKRERPDDSYQHHHHPVVRQRDSSLDIGSYLSIEHIKKEKVEEAAASAAAGSTSSAGETLKTCRKSQPTQSTKLNRSQENLDFNLTVTRTTRGHEQLLYEGYTYLKLTHQPSLGDTTRWKCTSYYATKTGCRARLHTTLDGLCVLIDSKTDHNHPPPDEKQLKIILFREQVKQIANNHPEMRPTEILSNARMLLDTSSSLGLKDESIMRYIQRIKSRNKQQQQIHKSSNGPSKDLKPEKGDGQVEGEDEVEQGEEEQFEERVSYMEGTQAHSTSRTAAIV